MKKLFAFVAAALVAFGFSACKGKNDPEVKNFDIQISNLEATSVSIQVVPTDTTATYYWDIFEASQVSEMTDAQIAEAFKLGFDETIEYYAQLGYDLTYADFILTGTDAFDYTKLTPNTEYIVVALALDENIAAKGASVRQTFKTLEQKEDPVPTDMTFQIEAGDITFNSASITVTPSIATATYYWGVVETEQIAGMTDEDLCAAAKGNIEYYIEMYAMFGYDMTFEDFLSKGADAYVYEDLKANTAYTVYAFAMGTLGTYAGAVAKYNFTTPEIEPKETIALDFHDAVIHDYRELDGSFQIVAADADTNLVVFMNPYSDTFAGSFTLEDLDPDYSGVTDYVADEGYGLAAAEFTGVETIGGATYEGWIIADNAVKYTFSFNAVLVNDEPAEAPARGAKKASSAKSLKGIKKGNLAKKSAFVSEKLYIR